MSDIEYTYEDPTAYDDAESFDGDGRLPPDWAARRHAVGVRQSGRCAGCGRELDGSENFVVEHVRTPADGGDHRLKNLVGRCRACADRQARVSETRIAPAGAGTSGSGVETAFSWVVFVAAFFLAASPYLWDIYSHAGPRAPDAFLAYLPWLVGEGVGVVVALLVDLAQFVGAMILIVLGALWLLGDL